MIGKKVLAVLTVLLVAPGLALAERSETLYPTPNDLSDLDHNDVYYWGIDFTLAPGEIVTAATLSFDDIRNWDSGANDLYVQLLDWAPLGVSHVWDSQSGGDYFEAYFIGLHSLLVAYEDLPDTPQDLVYEFTADDLVMLNQYLSDTDSRFGLGFDPDCHFYNNGVELTLVTPEPGALAVLGTGALLVLRRRR